MDSLRNDILALIFGEEEKNMCLVELGEFPHWAVDGLGPGPFTP